MADPPTMDLEQPGRPMQTVAAEFQMFRCPIDPHILQLFN